MSFSGLGCLQRAQCDRDLSFIKFLVRQLKAVTTRIKSTTLWNKEATVSTVSLNWLRAQVQPNPLDACNCVSTTVRDKPRDCSPGLAPSHTYLAFHATLTSGYSLQGKGPFKEEFGSQVAQARRTRGNARSDKEELGNRVAQARRTRGDTCSAQENIEKCSAPSSEPLADHLQLKGSCQVNKLT